MIKVENLFVTLNNQEILKDISFILENGHNLVVLGRSGCGKTVLIKTLLGIYNPAQGTVTIDDLDVHHSVKQERLALKKRFAMVFQNAALLDSFTVRQNVALPLYERGETDSEMILAKVIHSLQVVKLEHTLNLYPAELSGGMRKRVGIARALVYDPEYIVFDEPVSGLDPITASEVMYYIAKIADHSTATLITITHEMRNLESIGDQVLFLDEGKVIFYGPIGDMKASPDEFIQKFLA